VVAVAGALGDPAAARRWLDEVRHRRLAITGHDIVAAGLKGPAVGAALEAATEAMLDGRAPGREEQMAAALGR
jgi:tRNA nucleotidyltransferase (CCA-adding enzyme)